MSMTAVEEDKRLSLVQEEFTEEEYQVMILSDLGPLFRKFAVQIRATMLRLGLKFRLGLRLVT